MKPPASLVIEIPSNPGPAASVEDINMRMMNRKTHMKMRQMRMQPAPAKAFQLTITLAKRPEVSDMTPAMGPTDTSLYTHTLNRLPRMPLPKNMIAMR